LNATIWPPGKELPASSKVSIDWARPNEPDMSGVAAAGVLAI
jgi:hypothetical protein